MSLWEIILLILAFCLRRFRSENM
ncbi:MAG: hypothetical protein FI699_06270 [SAR202 cluster bacterium]|nr:hypothetical protein [SAR202 cluster bacterium]